MFNQKTGFFTSTSLASKGSLFTTKKSLCNWLKMISILQIRTIVGWVAKNSIFYKNARCRCRNWIISYQIELAQTLFGIFIWVGNEAQEPKKALPTFLCIRLFMSMSGVFVFIHGYFFFLAWNLKLEKLVKLKVCQLF